MSVAERLREGSAMSIAEREIVLGVSGGIAAYKAAALASTLVQRGAGVTAVLTRNARKFIGAATFAALTGRPLALYEIGASAGLNCVAFLTLQRAR